MRKALLVAALVAATLIVAGTAPAGSQAAPQGAAGIGDGEYDPAIDEAIAAYDWPDIAEDRSILAPGDDATADRLATGTTGFGSVEEAAAETIAGLVGGDRHAGQSWDGDTLTVYVTDVTAKEATSLGDAARDAVETAVRVSGEDSTHVVVESAKVDYATVQGWVETIGLEVLSEHDRPDVLVEQAPGGGVRVVHDKPISAELDAAIRSIVPGDQLHYEQEPGMAPIIDGHANRSTWNSPFAHTEAALQAIVGSAACTTSWHVGNGFGPFLMGDYPGCLSHANSFQGGVRLWCYNISVTPFQGMSGGPFYRIKPDGKIHALGIYKDSLGTGNVCATHIHYALSAHGSSMIYA